MNNIINKLSTWATTGFMLISSGSAVFILNSPTPFTLPTWVAIILSIIGLFIAACTCFIAILKLQTKTNPEIF